ncbi:MAG: GNAT family N-acetyltransferase [Ferruginibacter sp.]|nr:GNAT family N-acetyltransferase [Ferruginibacter sp.]
MHTINRTDSTDPAFATLVEQLDAHLAARDGEEHSFYAQFNKIDLIRHVIVLEDDGMPTSCGAMKAFDEETMEIKRMYTVPGSRGLGLASQVLSALESWAAELGYKKCVLETGRRQPEAIALYEKQGYKLMENYGQYAGVENSVCFGKSLKT